MVGEIRPLCLEFAQLGQEAIILQVGDGGSRKHVIAVAVLFQLRGEPVDTLSRLVSIHVMTLWRGSYSVNESVAPGEQQAVLFLLR